MNAPATLQQPNETHLLNFGFLAPFDIDANSVHVSFNKETGDVEKLQVLGSTRESSFSDLTHLLTENQRTGLKKEARLQYKKEYGYFPEHKPADA